MNIRTLLSCAAVLVFAHSTHAAPPPVEAFARHAEFDNIKISPDGKYFAAAAPMENTTALVLIDRSNMSSGTVLRPAKDEHVYWFEWATDSRILYMKENRVGGFDFPLRYGEIYASDVDGRDHKSIFGYRSDEQQTGTRLRVNSADRAFARIIGLMPNDPKRVLIATTPWTIEGNGFSTIETLDIRRGLRSKIAKVPMRNAGVVIDSDDRPRFASGWDDDYEWRVIHRPDPKGEWIDMPRLSAQGFTPLTYAQDGETVYGYGYDDDSILGLYRYEAKSNDIVPVLNSGSFDVERPLLVPRTSQIMGVYSEAEKPVYEFLDAQNPLSKTYNALLDAFAGQRVMITSTTADSSELIVRVSNDRNPGDFYLFDRAKNDAKYLLSSRSWLDPKAMAQVEPVRVEARDGLQIHGYMTYPNGKERKNLPLVVMPHGGPHGIRDTWSFDAEAQFLASRGYAVLQPNFRGSGGYGEDFEESGYKEWGAKMQDDVTDATLWAIDQGIAARDRICIYGGSYGGYAALMGAAREPDLYACVVGSAGVYDLELMHSDGDITDWFAGQGYLDKVISDNPELLRERSPINHVDKITAPVMLIHGGRDERVPIKHARQMRKALKAAGNAPEWMVFRKEAHGYYLVENRVEVFSGVAAFLDKHIGH